MLRVCVWQLKCCYIKGLHYSSVCDGDSKPLETRVRRGEGRRKKGRGKGRAEMEDGEGGGRGEERGEERRGEERGGPPLYKFSIAPTRHTRNYPTPIHHYSYSRNPLVFRLCSRMRSLTTSNTVCTFAASVAVVICQNTSFLYRVFLARKRWRT
jgi:hypothetical protein